MLGAERRGEVKVAIASVWDHFAWSLQWKNDGGVFSGSLEEQVARGPVAVLQNQTEAQD